jgi:hypothetical protein
MGYFEILYHKKNSYNFLEQERISAKTGVDHYEKLLNDVFEKEKNIDQLITQQETELNVGFISCLTNSLS